jgi:hypothetical protein
VKSRLKFIAALCEGVGIRIAGPAVARRFIVTLTLEQNASDVLFCI